MARPLRLEQYGWNQVGVERKRDPDGSGAIHRRY
jgi:hypothetical protein